MRTQDFWLFKLICLFGSFFDPEDGGSKLVRNFSKCLMQYTAAHEYLKSDTSSGLIYSSILMIEVVHYSETSLDF